MNILLITDAWKPQVNGVVTTLTAVVAQARAAKDSIAVYNPDSCPRKFPLPGYPEIKIGIPNLKGLKNLLLDKRWHGVHIATPEGPIGFIAANICRKNNIRFTVSNHTKFPEFIHSRLPFISVKLGWKIMRYLYRDAAHILASSKSMKKELEDHGFKQPITAWTRGTDKYTFYMNSGVIDRKDKLLCVSRVSPEKNLEEFFKLPGYKTMVGDGPYLEKYKKEWPNVTFVGSKTPEELREFYNKAEVFVFPSKTDTFGVVMIEAISCGLPIAAYPVTGPVDIIEEGINGHMSDDLSYAVHMAKKLDRKKVWKSSDKWTWEKCYDQFRKIVSGV